MACHLGASNIVLLTAETTAGKLRIKGLGVEPRPAEHAKISDIIKAGHAFAGLETQKIRISLKGQGVIVRFIQFPKMAPDELKSALSFEAESYIPFKMSEVVIDYHVLEDSVTTEKGEEMNILLIAVKKEEVYVQMKLFNDAGLEPDIVDCDILASVNALEYFHPEDAARSIAYLDLGNDSSSLCVLRAGKPRFIRDISFGDLDVSKRFRRKLGLNSEDADKLMAASSMPSVEAEEALKESYTSLATDLKVSLDYYLGQVPQAIPVTKLFIGGGAGDTSLISPILSESLGIPVQTMDILNKVDVDAGVDRNLLVSYAKLLPVCLGLCLRSE